MTAWNERTTIARKMTRLTMLAGMAGAMTLALFDCAAKAQHVAPAAEPAAADAPKKIKQKPKSKPAASQEAKVGKKDPAVAQQQIDTGVASLQAGKTDQAVQQFTSALTGGSLPSNLMARAHYQRGIAYRKQSKPALAISDLTHALWLKNGLNETERADALQNRIAAYRDAGLPDQADAEGAPKTAGVRTASAEPPVSTSTAVTSSIGTSKPSVGLAPTQESASPPSSGGLGGFFGNLFGGSSSATEAPAPVRTPAKAEPAVSAWSANTEVKPAAAARAAKPAAVNAGAAEAPLPWQQPEPARAAPASKPTRVASAAGGAATAASAAGRYQLQVAQFKTVAEAQAAAARIKLQFIGELAGREASITAVSAGGFGTLHRVSFGPFVDPAEWKVLCPKLLSAGNDCQPLSQ